MTKKNPAYYIDNKKFLQEISSYREQYIETSGACKMSNYLGSCFMNIAKNLSTKKNFYGYSYREEMISDAIFDCVRYAHKFDPSFGVNPFAYFTTVCYFAFIRKIQKEKKHLYTIYKAIDNSEIFGLLNTHQESDTSESGSSDIGYSKESRENMYKFITDYEKMVSDKKAPKEKKEEDDD